MRITSQTIIQFIENIVNHPVKKQQFTDVWIELPSLFDLFLEFAGPNEVISYKTFSAKLNFVSESKSHGLHHKKTWNTTTKVSNINIFDYFMIVIFF